MKKNGPLKMYERPALKERKAFVEIDLLKKGKGERKRGGRRGRRIRASGKNTENDDGFYEEGAGREDGVQKVEGEDFDQKEGPEKKAEHKSEIMKKNMTELWIENDTRKMGMKLKKRSV